MPSDTCCVLSECRFSIPAPVKRRRRALVVTNFVSLISVLSTKSLLTPLFLLFPKSLPTFREPLRSSHSHIPFGLLFNFQGTVSLSLIPTEKRQMATLNGKNILNLKNPLTCSHWEEQNYRVFLKNFLFYVLQKIPSLIWTKGAEMHTHFRVFLEKFFEKKFTLHLFGITKPNDTLFIRKTEKIFFILLRDDSFLLTEEKVSSLIPTGKRQIPTLFQKNILLFVKTSSLIPTERSQMHTLNPPKFLSLHLFGIGKLKRTLFLRKI